MEIDESANSVDLDEAAHYELPHLVNMFSLSSLYCQYDKA